MFRDSKAHTGPLPVEDRHEAAEEGITEYE
jgi:hypothetical protein